MYTSRIIPILTLSIIIGLFSCAQTEEGQRKRWAYNMERIELIEQKYPNFSSIASTIKEEAEETFAEALTTIDDELKVKLMSEASDNLSPAFVKGLFSFDTRAAKSRELSKKILEMSDGNTSALIAAISGMNVEQDINDARETIRSAQPTNLAGANRIVTDAIAPMEKNIKDMQEVIRKLESEAGEATKESQQ